MTELSQPSDLIAAEVLPDEVPFDFDFVAVDDSIPFATGTNGLPVGIDFTRDPHLLLSGIVNSGKTGAVQCLAYSALVSGADIAVLDVQKYGAEFEFVEDRATAFATTVADASATMRALYREVKRRAQLNANHKVGSIRGSAPVLIDFLGGGGSGRLCGLVDGFKLDGGLSTESALSAFAVVGLFDPGHDR